MSKKNLRRFSLQLCFMHPRVLRSDEKYIYCIKCLNILLWNVCGTSLLLMLGSCQVQYTPMLQHICFSSNYLFSFFSVTASNSQKNSKLSFKLICGMDFLHFAKIQKRNCRKFFKVLFRGSVTSEVSNV